MRLRNLAVGSREEADRVMCMWLNLCLEYYHDKLNKSHKLSIMRQHSLLCSFGLLHVPASFCGFDPSNMTKCFILSSGKAGANEFLSQYLLAQTFHAQLFCCLVNFTLHHNFTSPPPLKCHHNITIIIIIIQSMITLDITESLHAITMFCVELHACTRECWFNTDIIEQFRLLRCFTSTSLTKKSSFFWLTITSCISLMNAE